MIAVYSSLIDVFVIVLVIGQIISLNLSERILKWCRCWEITSLFLYSQLKSSAIFARTNCEYFSPNNWAAAELQRANKVILNLRTTILQSCQLITCQFNPVKPLVQSKTKQFSGDFRLEEVFVLVLAHSGSVYLWNVSTWQVSLNWEIND